jgi:hypothetical protein
MAAVRHGGQCNHDDQHDQSFQPVRPSAQPPRSTTQLFRHAEILKQPIGHRGPMAKEVHRHYRTTLASRQSQCRRAAQHKCTARYSELPKYRHNGGSVAVRSTLVPKSSEESNAAPAASCA